ncbi:MAG: GNAT family N-acetyltransferase [Alphaproteobacteria bacterium]|nr:MAG: GNAT family N-acetyltransferase [Alphaproteobacteria bacterium]
MPSGAARSLPPCCRTTLMTNTTRTSSRPGHFPHLLLRDGEVLGTVRIDLIDERAAGLRLIGIRPDVQRQGHGRTLLRLAEEAARALGRTEIVINAHPTSLEFYLAHGYRESEWGDRGPVPSGLVRVGKRLP